MSRSGLEAVTSQQQSAGAALEQLLASAQSRDRGQTKTNERIDEHIQVSGGCGNKIQYLEMAFKQDEIVMLVCQIVTKLPRSLKRPVNCQSQNIEEIQKITTKIC